MKESITRWRNGLAEPIAPSSKLWHSGLLLILGIFTVTTLAQSIATPTFEGSDEQRHYAYARYLVNHLSLPPRTWSTDVVEYYTYKVGQEAGQPPLYYIPVALLTALVPDADNTAAYVNHNQFVSPSDDAGLPYDNHNYYLHAAEENFPFHGVALAVRLGRLVSVVAGIFTLLGVYGIARALVPQRPAIALLATLMVACVPGVTFIFSVITNDAGVILFTTLGMWIAVRIAREGSTPKLAVLAGIFAGFSVLCKINGIWVITIIWLSLLISAFLHREKQPLKSSLFSLGLSAVVWLAMTGWWFFIGTTLDGDPLGITIHTVKPGQTLLGYLRFDWAFFSIDNLITWDRTTWYSVSWTLIHGPAWLYETFRYVYLIGILGFIGLCLQKVFQSIRSRHIAYVEGLQAVCTLLAVLYVIAFAYFWQLTGRSHLGRYLYPGLTSAAVLGAIGWGWWLGHLRRLHAPRIASWAFASVVIIALQYASVWGTINAITAMLPHSTTSILPRGITQTKVTFLDPDDHQTPVAELVGYRLHPQDLRPGNAMYVDLCWKSMGYAKKNFPYTLQLVGPGDERPGTRNSYHGLGSYPLTAWKPGEIFCDTTSAYVAFSGNQPRAYNLVVTLFDIQSDDNQPGPALPAVDGAGRSVYPVIGRARVAPDMNATLTPIVNLGDVAGLTGASIELLPTHTLSVTLQWAALSSPNVDAKVFMHVIDKDSGQVIAQDDYQPDDGWFPTNFWQKGDTIADPFEIALPAETNAEQVELQVGMYDAQTQERLPAVAITSQQRYTDDVITLPLNIASTDVK